MNKAEMLEALQRQTKLRPTHVKRVVDAIFDPEDGVISRQIKRGGKVTIAGFGTFETRERAARTGRNPQTGEEIAIAASTSVGFKAAAQLKRAVNG